MEAVLFHDLNSDSLCCHVIYVLRCPDTNAVRYVGTTRNARYRRHTHMARKRNRQSAVNAWTSELADAGKSPVFEVVAELRLSHVEIDGYTVSWPDVAARVLERQIIKDYAASGCDLLNALSIPVASAK